MMGYFQVVFCLGICHTRNKNRMSTDSSLPASQNWTIKKIDNGQREPDFSRVRKSVFTDKDGEEAGVIYMLID